MLSRGRTGFFLITYYYAKFPAVSMFLYVFSAVHFCKKVCSFSVNYGTLPFDRMKNEAKRVKRGDWLEKTMGS